MGEESWSAGQAITSQVHGVRRQCIAWRAQISASTNDGASPLRGVSVSAAIAGRLLLSGVAAVVIGLVWGRWFPINKALWTSSYVAFTAGAALLGLAACYWLIEIRRSRWWTGPFRILGVNALAVFFLSTLLAILLARISIPGTDGRPHSLQAIVFDALFAPWTSPAAASLAWAAANVVFWLVILWPFSRRALRLTV